MVKLKWKIIRLNENNELKLERQGTIVVRTYINNIFIRYQISDYVEDNGLMFIHSEGVDWWSK